MQSRRPTAALAPVLVALLVTCGPACTTPTSGNASEPCVGVTCSGHGLCVISAGAAACECETGYAPSGLLCVASAGCDPNPCVQPHQTRCEIDSHQIVCRCDVGWHDSGAGCVPDSDNPCFPNPCTALNQTVCAIENDQAVCKCDAGYSTDANGDCTVGDPCTPNPCTTLNQGQCVNEAGTAKCNCNPGYVEDATGACVPGDDCHPNPCTTPHETVCTILAGEAYCTCDPGWKADGQGGCVEQSACDPNPCNEPHKSKCSSVGGVAKCSCDPLYIDDGSGTCVLAPDPTCAQAHPSGDQYENDDCATNAKELPVGATQTRSIDLAGDVDWMQSTLEAGHIYRFDAVTGVDLKVYLYDADGVTLLDDVDDPEVIDFAPTVTGVYYWKAHHYYATSTGAYTAKLLDLGVDDHGNDAASATAVTTLGTAVPGNIEFGGDNDWFKFDAVAGHLYSVNTTGIDTYVYVVDTDGTTILSQSDYPPLYLTAATAGPYYVRVRHYYSTSTDVGAYALTITDLGVEVSGDDAASAGLVTPGTSYGAMISPADDQDWYRLDTVAGHTYSVTATGAVATRITLYQTDGTTVITGPIASPAYLTAAGVGPYFVKVQGYTTTVTGLYSLAITDLGLDDHGDDAQSATPLPVGTPGVGGWIVPAGDQDWFKFDATANRAYKVACTTSAFVSIFAVDGTTLLKESAPPAYVFATDAGTYYVRVKHTSPTGVLQYTVTVEDVGADDHGNDALHATLASTSGTGVDGAINYPGDDDWFKFQATAGHIYSINTAARSPSTYFDGYVYIVGVDGTTVLKESDPVPVVFTATVDGWYFVRVRHYSATATDYYYSLTVTDVGMDDCGSGSSTTCVITPGTPPGTPVPGRIEVGGDDDWWAFDATAGRIYKCTTTGIDTYVYLYAPDGTTSLKSGDNPELILVATESGRYFYKVKGVSTTTVGNYNVICTDEGADDYPNGPVGAPLVPADGTPQNGSIQYGGDLDWVSFAAEAGATYVITAPPVASADTVVELFDTTGGTSIGKGDDPPTVTKTITTAGVYYVKVSLYTTTATGAYTLSITKQ